MYIRFSKPHLLSEIHKSTLPVADFRKHFPVAIIDNIPFNRAESLANHNFDVKELGDIKDIAAVAAYPIIACDIRDVGAHFDSPFGGAHLIAEIRKKYPDKYIIAYSAGEYGPEFKKLLDHSDVFLRRGASINDWVDSLDNAIQAVGDPVRRWKRIRGLMLNYDVPAFEIFLLEDAYIRSIQTHNEFVLDKALKRARRLQSAGSVVEKVAEGLITFVKLYVHLAT